MVYDAAMPEELEIRLNGIMGSPGLPPTIRALMKVNIIRDELISHLFGRYSFQWTDHHQLRGVSARYQCDLCKCFKRDVLPHINNLTFRFGGPASLPRHKSSHDILHDFLSWARWRSLRSHLFPWSLKKLTLVEKYYIPWPSRYNAAANLAGGADGFLMDVCVVPGLDSLSIVLNSLAGAEAVKEFLERCASCEIDGRIGYCPYGQEKVSEWFCLQDNQVVRIAG